MPSESSIYSKIQVVLSVAKSVNVDTVVALQQEIEGLRPSNFLSRQYDKEKDAFITDISIRAIRRIVGICYMLKLIEADGSLTAEGRQALRKNRFDKVVAEQVQAFLQHKGVSLSKVNNIIQEDLRSNPPLLPTSKDIWIAVGNEMKYSVFSTMLTLLAQCGVAHISQKKIYLSIDIK